MSTGTNPPPARTTPAVWLVLLALAAGQGWLIYRDLARPGDSPAPPAAFDFAANGRGYGVEHARAFAQALHEAGAYLKQPGATLDKMRATLHDRHSAMESEAFDARFEAPLGRIIPPGPDAQAKATPAQMAAYGDALIAIGSGLEGK